MPIMEYYEAQGKVRSIDGQPAADDVFVATQDAIEPVISGQVLEANIKLLKAAHDGDWETYASLADGSIITIDHDETFGLPVRGVGFHKKFFDAMHDAATAEQADGAAPSRSDAPLSAPGSTTFRLLDPSVRILGKGSAAVSYVRLVTPRAAPEGGSAASRMKPMAFSETRIW